MLFRPQRHTLADAMAEVFEFTTRAELLAHLQTGYFAPTAIVSIEPYPRAPATVDTRIGWLTYIVIAQYPDGTEQPAGFTNGPLVD